MEITKWKNYKNTLKPYIELDKKFLKFDGTEIEIYNFHQDKRPILIENIDINKMVVSNKISFGKREFKYFIRYKGAKKLDLYAYSFKNCSKNMLKLGKKSAILLRKNLTVNLYTMENI